MRRSRIKNAGVPHSLYPREKKPSMLRIGSRASCTHEGEKPSILSRLSRHSMIIAAPQPPCRSRSRTFLALQPRLFVFRLRLPYSDSGSPCCHSNSPRCHSGSPCSDSGPPRRDSSPTGGVCRGEEAQHVSAHDMLAKLSTAPTAALKPMATPSAGEKAVVAPRAATPVQQAESIKETKPNILRRLGSRTSSVKDKLKNKVSTSSSTKKLDKGKGKVVV